MVSHAPGEERPRRHAFGLVVIHLILALAAVLLFLAGFQDYKWPRWQSIFLEALAFAQVGLVTAILAIGSLSIVFRVAAAATVLMFWVIVLGALDFQHENWLIIFALQMAGIGSCLAIARFLGARLTSEPSADTRSHGADKYRFSLRQMLLVMTIVSVLLCVGTIVSKLWAIQDSVDHGVLPRAEALGLVLAPIVLVALLAVFRNGRKTTPFLLLVVVTLLAGYAVSRVDQVYRTAWWSSLSRGAYPIAYLYLIGAYAVIVYASLAILRAGGYRMVRQSGNP